MKLRIEIDIDGPEFMDDPVDEIKTALNEFLGGFKMNGYGQLKHWDKNHLIRDSSGRECGKWTITAD